MSCIRNVFTSILLSSSFHIKQIYVFFVWNILISHILFKTGSTEAPIGLQGSERLSSSMSQVDDPVDVVSAIIATHRSWQYKSRLIGYVLPMMIHQPVQQRR